MVLDIIVLVKGEVCVVPAEVGPLDPDGPKEGVCHLLLQSCILKGIKGGTDDFSELVVWIIWPHELSLISKGFILSSLLYLVLNKSLVLVSKIDLLDLRFYLLNTFREGVYMRVEVPNSTRNL